ncbi:50S ribosomal protein L19 [Candidatus Microgenomates bacterium]|nr:50S ribosomal protein L19 [Candidatus Microgenomates bacterium]
MNPLLSYVNKKYNKGKIPDIATGDIVRVAIKVEEGGKTRTQIFEGIVIARDGGNGVSASITVRKIASGVGVEKKYILLSPLIENIKIVRSSKTRRKKIFFLRGLTGKAAKLKESQRAVLEAITHGEEETAQESPAEDMVADAESSSAGQTIDEASKQEESLEKTTETKIEESDNVVEPATEAIVLDSTDEPPTDIEPVENSAKDNSEQSDKSSDDEEK